MPSLGLWWGHASSAASERVLEEAREVSMQKGGQRARAVCSFAG